MQREDPASKPRLYLTEGVPGLPGRLREAPEDFIVDEVPLYDPCGEGEHLYLRIEKRSMATSFAADQLASALGVRARDVATAGLKDRHAVTTQWVSIHDPAGRQRIEPGPVRPGLRVLEAARHTNKLRRGHLAANRFTITIRRCAPDAEPARATLALLAERGVPNRAGEQRFGRRANNHLVGRAYLLGRFEEMLDELLGPDDAGEPARRDAEARRLYAEGRFDDARRAFPPSARAERAALSALARGADSMRACRAIERDERAFWLTAIQSAIFNHVLDDRLERGALDAVEPGDVVMLFGEGRKGPTFLASEQDARDPDTLQRARRMRITATGPLWGPKMTRAGGLVVQREREALRAFALREEDFDAFAQRERVELSPGARRPLRALLRDPDAEAGEDERGPFVRCRFTLSPGAFATIVMEEVMKRG